MKDQVKELFDALMCNYDFPAEFAEGLAEFLVDEGYGQTDELKKQIADLRNRLHMIWAIGVDYDGCNRVESLKELIDELVSYTQLPEDQIPDITSRTGRWVQKERVVNEYGDTESSFVCSSCQTEYQRREYTPKSFIEHHKFCPNCGAKMRSAN